MTFLTKPYTPIVFTLTSKTFNVYGKSFFRVTNVYLSGYPYENQTFYNPFSAVPKLSAQYPGFFAVKLSSSSYQSNNDNTITLTIPPATRGGYVDVIVENPAGYGKLTQYAVKYLYNNIQTQLDLRPWSSGIKVLTGVEITLPDNQIYTLNSLSALLTFNYKNIVTFAAGLSDQMYSINNDFIVTIQGDNIITI